MNEQHQIVRVNFHGGEIEATKVGDDIWMSIRRACEHMGIDPKSQQDKLRDKEWATCRVISTSQGHTQNREQFMLHLDSVPMWLATIDTGRVSPESRPLLIAYQKEAARVLRDHFFKAPVSMAPPTHSEALRGWADALDENTRLLKAVDSANTEIKQLKPYADVGMSFANTEGCYDIGEAAKMIYINGAPMDKGRNKLFDWLRKNGYVFRAKNKCNEPKQEQINKGRFILVPRTVNLPKRTKEYTKTMITPKGISYIIYKLRKDPEYAGAQIDFIETKQLEFGRMCS